MKDEFFMKRALSLARRGEKWVSPNPMVGAVIVKNQRIIAEGYHRFFGGAHAEIDAINNSSEEIKGSTMYVTLEPCVHYGKTPPCVNRIIEANPARIVIGSLDPNPRVCGKGLEILNRHGIETTVGVMEAKCMELNERFFKYIKTGVPFVTLKFAQTIDGRIATHSGHSQWISSFASRKLAHRLRSSHDAVLVGIGTLLKDDPELTVRLTRGRNPVRVIIDSRLSAPTDAKAFKNQKDAKTFIATTHEAANERGAFYKNAGIELLSIDRDHNNLIDLKKLLNVLGKKGISSVLIEGGATIITSVLKEKLADRIFIFIAPKISGKGIEAVQNLGIVNMDDALKLSYRRIMKSGGDIVIDGRIE